MGLDTHVRLVELGEQDLPELAALCATSLSHDDCDHGLLRSKLLSLDEAIPCLRLGLRVGDQLIAVATGALNGGAHGEIEGHVKLVATHPTARRSGYARMMLGELEARFAAVGAGVARLGFARRFLMPGVDLRYSKALCLFDALGYRRINVTYNLDVDLTRRSFDPAPRVESLAGHGVTVRRLEPTDSDMLRHHMAERWGAGWLDGAMEALETSRAPIPCHLATLAGEIIGFAVYDIARPGWLGPIGTNTEVRGRGVGTALLHACLFDWQRQGRRHGEIAGIGPLYFYVTSCDAVMCRTFQQYEKPLQPRLARMS